MISRIWHGWTSRHHAEAYEKLLRGEIFAGITGRNLAGYRGIHLLRRDVPEGVEFVTVMWFDSIQAVNMFAGEDHDATVIPPEARALLSNFVSVRRTMKSWFPRRKSENRKNGTDVARRTHAGTV